MKKIDLKKVFDFSKIKDKFQKSNENGTIKFNLNSLKEFDLKKLKPSLFNKYDYDVDEVIGAKGKERFILYTKKKLIRIYRDSLAARALLSSYIPIEHAIFYSFEVEKSVIEKVDLNNFIETKVYEEAGVDETEEYLIKYKIIDSMKDEKIVTIEIIIVPVGFIQNGYKDLLEEAGYIDYISFPAFAYKALYEEKIIKKANDVFVVFLYDKVFLTFYENGELLSILTVSGGLDKIYQALEKLKIKDFGPEMFERLLTKKGVNSLKYGKNEKKVLDIIKEEFLSLVNIINSQIDKVTQKYNISQVERVFVISEYGNIDGLQEYIKQLINVDTFGFEFYEEYNLDRLSVNPFLFLGMLEAHNAYKNGNQDYNFSLFLRKPTFFYRPSGRLFLITFGSILLTAIYPLYLYLNGLSYERKNKILSEKVKSLQYINNNLNIKIRVLEARKKKIIQDRKQYTEDIKLKKELIKNVYEFKYSYIPKSSELTDITLLLNKNKVYLDKLTYAVDNMVQNSVYNKKKKDVSEESFKGFVLRVFAFKDTKIPALIDDLVNSGFKVDTPGVIYENNKYKAIIRIKE
ncbi:MAG: hypothetical protein ABGX26_04170 [Nautiliaceae bacterium]|jgi:hypothetical protein